MLSWHDLDLDEFEMLLAYSSGINSEQKERLEQTKKQHKTKARLKQKETGLKVGTGSNALIKNYPHLFKKE